MADETPQDLAPEAPPEPRAPRPPSPPAPSMRGGVARALRKYGLGLPLALLLGVILGLAGLDSPLGHRFLADWLEQQSMANGLSVGIGRIDGSIYGSAQLEDVTLRDPAGIFLRVPVVALDWRPLAWIDNDLDIHRLELRRGLLLRAPHLRPGNPNAPLLPDFDIRIDHLAIEHMVIARGIAGTERRIDLRARADIRRHRALIDLDSRLGGADRLKALLDADEKAGRFVLALDYEAPRGGLLAALTGAQANRMVNIDGRGGWANWRGTLLATQDAAPVASLTLVNRAGLLGLGGEVRTDPLLAPRQRAGLGSALGPVVAVRGEGRLTGTTLTGRLAASSPTLHATAVGGLDLHANAFQHLVVDAGAPSTLPLGSDVDLQGATAHLVLDGPFSAPVAQGHFAAAHWKLGTVALDNFVADGTAHRDNGRWTLPLTATAARAITGNTDVDPRLVSLRGSLTLALSGTALASDNVVLTAPGLAARAVLRGDLGRGGYALSGRVTGRGVQLGNAGTADAAAAVTLAWGRGGSWGLGARLAGRMTRIASPGVANVVGESPAFTGELSAGAGLPLLLPHATLTGQNLTLNLTGRRLADGSAQLAGTGHQVSYGSFTINAQLATDGPHAALVFADPLPAAGIKDMHVALAPETGGFGIETSGASALGPFAGTVGLSLPEGAPARLEVRHLTVSDTLVTGALTFEPSALAGQLALSGGGVSGTVRLAPKVTGQGIDATLVAKNAHFGGAQPLSIGNGQIEVSGLILKHHTSITASAFAQGIGKGKLFIGRAAARLGLVDGSGQLTAALAGRRGSRFELQLTTDIAPSRLALAANGVFAGQTIATPRRVLLSQRSDAEGGGWRLAPSEIDFGQGRAIASGLLGNGTSEIGIALSDMPLSLGDVIFADLGLGGNVTGLFSYARPREGVPTGQMRLLVKGLTRSGLVVTSRPIDLAVVGELSAEALQLRAVATDSGAAPAGVGPHVLGRMQARIGGLPVDGAMIDRLRAGHLAAGMRYSGPADAVWRLMALDAFDLTGPIDLAADISGGIDDPRITGSLASDALRLQSSITGTDIGQIVARGGFAGSRLTLSSLAGHTTGGGQVVGSGSVDFSGITDGHGPAIDLRLAASKAQLLNRTDMALTATGPLRIVSDGTQGTIAGRVEIDSARWRLGQAPAAAALPNIPTREINRSADIAPASNRNMPWHFLFDTSGPGKIRVLGLGLDSEWGASIQLRGTIDDPAIEGSADLLGGSYEFAGQHFDLTRGHLTFDGTSPPDPRLDIAASNSANGLTATVTVRGSSLKPDISFTSVPPLPEEELLSRLLFGTSVTGISAPEALQLGAALAALHGGGGLDPINRLRSIVGLDRLRIVSADPTVPHQTGVAVGKNIGRHLYAEAMSDGHGYSATSLEFRITRWLSLLASVSTIGRQSVNARITHDY